MPFEIKQFDIPVGANGQYNFYEVPTENFERPITIGGEIPAGTFNLDSFLIFVPTDNLAAYLDSTLNRGTPYDIPLGQLNGWLLPKWQLHFQVSAFAVAGNVIVRMWMETILKEQAPNIQDVRVREQPIQTRPRLFNW